MQNATTITYQVPREGQQGSNSGITKPKKKYSNNIKKHKTTSYNETKIDRKKSTHEKKEWTHEINEQDGGANIASTTNHKK